MKKQSASVTPDSRKVLLNKMYHYIIKIIIKHALLSIPFIFDRANKHIHAIPIKTQWHLEEGKKKTAWLEHARWLLKTAAGWGER